MRLSSEFQENPKRFSYGSFETNLKGVLFWGEVVREIQGNGGIIFSKFIKAHEETSEEYSRGIPKIIMKRKWSKLSWDLWKRGLF